MAVTPLRVVLPFFPLCLAACSQPGAAPGRPAAPPPVERLELTSVKIQGVPHVKQRPDFCGEACVEMFLRHRGVMATQDDVFALTGVSPASGRGAYTKDMVRALRTLGFSPGKVWHRVEAKKATAQLDRLFAAMHRDLRAGVPSIVCTRYNGKPNTTEHFRLVLGYDAKKDEVLYHEPAAEKGAYLRMKRAAFLSLWPLKYKKDRWTVIRMRLDAEKIAPPPRRPGGVTPADLAQAVQRLRPTLPAEFTLRVEPPFVVVGNSEPEMVNLYATDTVRRTVARLRKAYFKRDPDRVITVWLFRDLDSYNRATRREFGKQADTPYGFYSSQRNMMMMNIGLGGGTLVHELVHPYIEANFPNCPAWFNEGLGSLYEQSSTRDGHIIGLTNWRLAGLKRAIKAGKVPSFETLTGTTSHQFYDMDPGTNYAQARYLLYYLQEQGLLHKYYHRFFRDRETDPTGLKTLRAILGPDGRDMTAFKKKWERYVLGLRFSG